MDYRSVGSTMMVIFLLQR